MAMIRRLTFPVTPAWPGAVHPTFAQSAGLTIDEVLHAALADNLSMRSGPASGDAAAQGVDAAKAAWWPRVSSTGV